LAQATSSCATSFFFLNNRQLAPVKPPVQLKTKLLQRIRNSKQDSVGSHESLASATTNDPIDYGTGLVEVNRPTTKRTDWSRGRAWIEFSIALASCLLGVVGGYSITKQFPALPVERVAVLASPSISSIRSSSPEQDSMNIRFVSSSAQGNLPGKSNRSGRWYVVVDPDAKQVRVSVQTAQRLGLNRVLHAWLTTTDGKQAELGELEHFENDISQAIFDLNIDANANFQITVAHASSERMVPSSGDILLDIRMTERPDSF